MTRPLSDAALARVWERVQASGDPELMAALDELMDRRDDEPDPAGETTYPPTGEPADWFMDPDRIAYQLHRLTVDLNLEWPTRPAGNPEVFYYHLSRDPLTPDTRALAARWAAHPPPPPEHWQTAIRLCPYRTGQKILGADIIIDPSLPPHTFKLNDQLFTLED